MSLKLRRKGLVRPFRLAPARPKSRHFTCTACGGPSLTASRGQPCCLKSTRSWQAACPVRSTATGFEASAQAMWTTTTRSRWKNRTMDKRYRPPGRARLLTAHAARRSREHGSKQTSPAMLTPPPGKRQTTRSCCASCLVGNSWATGVCPGGHGAIPADVCRRCIGRSRHPPAAMRLTVRRQRGAA